MNFRCVIFDFDGTLANTLPETLLILNQLADTYGFRKLSEVDLLKVKTMSLAQFIRFLGIPAWSVPKLLTNGKRMLTERLDAIDPFPDIPEVLTELKASTQHLGILTSNSAANVEHFLKSHNMEHFEFVSSAKKLLGKAKYLKAIMKTFSLKHDEVLYVGDEIRDIEAAHAVEMPVVGVTWGFNTAEALEGAMPDFLINSPRELLDIVATREG